MKFRPLLWPTLIALPAFLILLALGFWQLERREWKLGLIAEMSAQIAEKPVPLDSLSLRNDRFRPVRVTGRFDHAKEVYWFTIGPGGEAGYHVLTPLLREGKYSVLIDRGFVPERLKEPAMRREGQIAGEVEIEGLVRYADRRGPFTPADKPEQNIWFTRDPTAMAARTETNPLIFVQAYAPPNPGGWPKAEPPAVTLTNNHLSYALTWFGLAGALFVIYLLYHRSRGLLA